MTARRTTPAQFVRIRLSGERRARILDGVLATKPRRSVHSVWPLLAAAAALVLVVAYSFAGRPPAGDIVAEPPSTRWLATGGKDEVIVLRSGRRLELAEATQLRVLNAAETRVRLERGEVRCGGASATGQVPFVVEAGNAEISLVKAQMTVRLDLDASGPSLSVAVESGVVEVERDSTVSSVRAGETWSSRGPHRVTDAVSPVPERNSAPVAPSTLPPQPNPAEPSSQSVWARAQTARRTGDAATAARAYEELRRDFPTDPRSGLAAFELGRIRLDSLGDPAGALAAFDFALAHGSEAFFAEDAAAGRVTALDRLGNRQACRRARAAFLKRHGKSPHRTRLLRMCGSP